jgi:hypothetical protein
MYEGTAVSIDKGINTRQRTEMSNQVVRQACLSPTFAVRVCASARAYTYGRNFF